MTTHRMLPPVVVAEQTRVVFGRSYTGTPGYTYDIESCDAEELSANGWIDCALSGPTSERPSASVGPNSLFPGLQFLDTDLDAVVVWDGATWRNVLTGASA
jgi:hypothetical protein